MLFTIYNLNLDRKKIYFIIIVRVILHSRNKRDKSGKKSANFSLLHNSTNSCTT